MEKHFGLIGRSLAHSFSPAWFAAKFAREGIEASYRAYPLAAITDFPELIAKEHLSGVNVTVPYKEAVLPFLTDIHPDAEAIGAVNCIRIRGEKLTGFNTDWTGFTQSFQSWTPQMPTGALVLGTGGAAKAVTYALRQLDIPFRQVSRTAGIDRIPYESITAEILRQFPLLVNTTPLGTWPDVSGKPPLPYHLLTSANHLYDLVYNPQVTAFMEEGYRQGCAVKNGLEMLILQAEESWRIMSSD